MKKRILNSSMAAAACALLMNLQVFAQSQLRWSDIRTGTGNGADVVSATATDGSGNIYVAGTHLSSANNKDPFVIVYGPDGSVQRFSKIETNDLDETVTSMTVDASGNVYLGGNTIVRAIPAGSAGLAVNDQFAYIAKLDRNGNNFVLSAGFAENGLVYSVYGTSGNPAAASYPDQIHQIVINGGSVDVLLSHEDTDPGQNRAVVRMLRLNASNGDITLTGPVVTSGVNVLALETTTLVPGINPIAASIKLVQNSTDYFIALTANGGRAFLVRIPKSNLTADQSNQVPAGAGSDFINDLQINTNANLIYAALSRSSAGGHALNVRQYTTALAELNTGGYTSATHPASANAGAFALFVNGNDLYVTGAENVAGTPNNFVIKRINATGLTEVWEQTVQFEAGAAVTVPHAGTQIKLSGGRVYAGGYVSNAGEYNAYVDVLDAATGAYVANGSWFVEQDGSGVGTDHIAGLFVDATGRATIAATQSNTNTDFFTAQYCFPSDITAVTSPTAICPGSSSNITTSSVLGNIISYAWSPASGLNSATTQSPIATPTIVPITPAADATVVYTVTATNNQGCTRTTATPIIVKNKPQIADLKTNKPSNTVCLGDPILLFDDNGLVAGATYTWSGSDGFVATGVVQNQTVVPTQPTDYRVTITSPSGCISVAGPLAVQVVTAPTKPIVTSSAGTAAGNGVNFCGAVNTTLTAAGSFGDTYTWSPSTGLSATAGKSVIATPTANITYTVSVSNTTGCTNTANFEVRVNNLASVPTLASTTAFVPATSDTHYVCNTVNTQYSVATNATYTIQWKLDGSDIAGATQPVLPNRTSAGAYSVVVSDPSTGCTGKGFTANARDQIIRVNESNLFPGITALTSASFCPLDTVRLQSSSVLPNFQWLVGGAPLATATLSTLAYGGATNNIALQSVNACGTFVSTNFTATRFATPITPTLTPTAASTICPGVSTIIAVSNNADYSAFSWSAAPVASIIGQNTFQMTSTPSTTTTYTVLATDANGCTVNSAKTINTFASAAKPSIGADRSSPMCSTLNITLNSSPATSFSWLRNNVLISSGPSASLTISAPVPSGSYAVQITDANSCTNISDIFAVAVETPLSAATVTPFSTTNLCPGGSVTLGSSNLPSFQWFLNGTAVAGATQVNYIAAPVASGTAVSTSTYTVRGQNACGLSPVSNSVVVSVAPQIILPIISSSGKQDLCSGDSTRLSVTNPQPGISYRWRIGGTIIPSAVGTFYTARTTGQYSVDAHDNGCQSVISKSISIVVSNTIPANPGRILTPSGTNTYTICQGGSAVIYVPAGELGTHYSWARNGATIPNSDNSALTVSQTGFYSVLLINGCGSVKAQDTVYVSTSSLPNDVVVKPSNGPIPGNGSNKIDTTICQGSPLTLKVSPVQAGVDYVWYKNGSQIPSSNFYELPNANVEANYTVKVILRSSGCFRFSTDTAAVKVITPPQPVTINLAPDRSVCVGDVIRLSTPKQPLNSYQWSQVRPGSTQLETIFGATSDTLTLTSSVPFTGTYTVSITNSCGVKSGDLTSIEFRAQPQTGNISYDGQISGIDSVAFCSSVHKLSINPTPTNVLYQWYDNRPQPTALPPNAGGTSPTLSISSTGTWSVQVRYANGVCKSSVSQPFITRALVAPILDSILIAKVNGKAVKDTFCSGNAVLLRLKRGKQRDVDSIQWYHNGNPILASNDTVLYAISGGSYTVKQFNICGSAESLNSLRLTQLDPPRATAISFVGGDTICDNSQVVLFVPTEPVAKYTWYRDNIIVQLKGISPSYTTTATGNYRVEVENQCGIVNSVNKVFIKVLPAPLKPIIREPSTGSTSSFTLCLPGSTKLEASQEPNFTYLWERDNFVVKKQLNGFDYTADVAGTYVVKKSNGYCSVSSTPFVINSLQKPASFIIQRQSGCTSCCTDAGETKLVIVPDQSAVNWFRNGTLVFNGPVLSIDHLNASTATYTAQVVNQCGSLSNTGDPIAVTITQSPQSPVINPVSATACISDGFATVTYTADGLVDKFTYTSSTGNSQSVSIPIPASVGSVRINLNTNSTFTATVSKGACESKPSAPFNVKMLDKPADPVLKVTDGQESFCKNSGGFARLAIDVPVQGQTYTWTVPTGASAIPSGALQATVVTGGVYSVRATNQCGTAVSNPITITEFPVPDKPQVVQNGKVLVVTNNQSGYTYEWRGPATQGNPPVSNGVSFAPTVEGVYQVIVTNSNGCTAINAGINFSNVSVVDVELSKTLRVYPNPSNGVFNLELTLSYATDVDVIVRDMRGITVFVKNFKHTRNSGLSEAIDISTLSSGVYTLEVKTNKASAVLRLMKNN